MNKGQNRLQNIKNEADKRKHLENINTKSKLQQTIFQNPFFNIEEDEDEDVVLLEKFQQLEESQIRVNKEVSVQLQHRVKTHIIDHKLKNNYDFVRLKYLVRIWREQAQKIKIEDEWTKANQYKETKENYIDQLIKDTQYENLKQQTADEQPKVEEQPEDDADALTQLNRLGQMQLDEKVLFKMPEQDLLQYIPYCTDIYLGKD